MLTVVRTEIFHHAEHSFQIMEILTSRISRSILMDTGTMLISGRTSKDLGDSSHEGHQSAAEVETEAIASRVRSEILQGVAY